MTGLAIESHEGGCITWFFIWLFITRLCRLATYLASFKWVSQIERGCVGEAEYWCQVASVFRLFFSLHLVQSNCAFSFLLRCTHSVVRHQRSCWYTPSAQCPEFSDSHTHWHAANTLHQTHTHTHIHSVYFFNVLNLNYFMLLRQLVTV